MVTKSKKGGKGRARNIKVLQLNKETVKNLTPDQARKIRGGSLCMGEMRSTELKTPYCPKTVTGR